MGRTPTDPCAEHESPLARIIVRTVDALYLPPVARWLPLRTFRYGVCGAANVVLGWVLYYAVLHYAVGERVVSVGAIAMTPYIASLAITFPVTFLAGFWLNRNVAFRCSPLSGWMQIGRYALTVAGALLLNYVSLKLLVGVCGFWATPSKILTDAIVTLYSYLTARHFTFRGSVE